MSVRNRKILFMPYDDGLKELFAFMGGCSKLCLVVWAHRYSEKYVSLFEEYCEDERVRQAREAAYLWAEGAIRMPEAKRFILEAHKAARECGNAVAEAAARAVAQAASTVHSARHAGGLALYGLTALAKKYGKDSDEVGDEISRLTDGLASIAEEKRYEEESWAEFLEKDV